MDSNINYCYPQPHHMCHNCPVNDLNKVITFEGEPFEPYTFSILPFEPKEPIMLFCEPQSYCWSGKGTCSVTITGDTKDIEQLIKNIKIENR